MRAIARRAVSCVFFGALATSAAAQDSTTIQNPVVATNAPDPGAIRVGDTYYVVTTSGDDPNGFSIRSSTDLDHWQPAGSIFPAGSPGRPSWAVSDFWAPEIHKVGNEYVACYTARDASGKLCVGLATAPSVTGPYTDVGAPVVRDPSPDSRHGDIDPTIFHDSDGSTYLYWKADGNAYGGPCVIYAQRLAPNLSLEGQPTALITNDQPWEGAVVEAPWVEKHGGLYYLYYSGNWYANSSYAVGVARSTSPLGPFVKAPGPILRSNSQFTGPGHIAIVTDPAGQDYILFHSWLAGHEGDGNGPGRELLVNRVRWDNGWPAVNDGTPAATDVGPSQPDEGLPPPAPVRRPPPRSSSSAPSRGAHHSGFFGWIGDLLDDVTRDIEAAVSALDGGERATPGMVGALGGAGG